LSNILSFDILSFNILSFNILSFKSDLDKKNVAPNCHRDFSPTKRPCPPAFSEMSGAADPVKTSQSDAASRREIKLSSVLTLRERVTKAGHPALRDLVG
jgi:hypothetical protein